MSGARFSAGTRARFLPCCRRLLAAVMLLLAGCASEDEKKVADVVSAVTDPVSFQVEGISGEVRDNVMKDLAAMPPVSRSRARIFVRSVRDRVTQAMKAYGYYTPIVKVTPPKRDDTQDTVMKISVNSGKPVFVREFTVDIIGEGAFYQSFRQVIRDCGLHSYAALNHEKYEALKDALRSHALALGFFDAEMVSSRILIYKEENAADITIIYDTGKRYNYGEAVLTDRAKTLLSPAERLYTLERGKPFSTQEINSYISELTQTGYYRSVDVSPRVEERHDQEVPVYIDVERQPANLMRLGVGFSTDEGPRALLAWDKPMLNAAGHSLSSYARVSKVRTDAQMIYKIPRSDPNRNYYYVKLAQIHTDFNDTLSDRSHFSLHYVHNSRTKWWRDFSLRFEYEDYTQGSEKGHKLNFMPGFQLTRRDTSGGIDPHTGYSIMFDLCGGSRYITDQDFLRFLMEWKLYFSPTPNTRLLTRVQQGVLLGRDSRHVPPSLRFFAGGDQSVRGYGYMKEAPRNSGGLKGGRYLTSGTAEYQFPTGLADSRFAVFLDAALVCDEYDGGDQVIFGPGIGFRYMTKYGALKVDLGYGLQHDSGFKLHLSFGPEF